MRCLFLLIVFMNAVMLQAKEVSVLAIHYPPYTTPSIKNGGLAFEKLRARSELAQYQLKPFFVPPSRAGKMLRSGDWCLSFYPPYDQSRGVYKWLLSDEDIRLGFYRLIQPEPFSWDSLNALKGQRVAMLRSFSKAGLSGLLYKHGLVVQEVETLEQGFQLLFKDRVDFVFSDPFAGEYIARQYQFPLQQLQFSRSSLQVTQWHVWVNQACEEVYQQVMQAQK